MSIVSVHNASDFVRLNVEYHSALTAVELYDLTVHYVGKSVKPADTVGYADNSAELELLNSGVYLGYAREYVGHNFVGRFVSVKRAFF